MTNNTANIALSSTVDVTNSSLTDTSIESQLSNEHLEDLVKLGIDPEIALLGCESRKSGKDLGLPAKSGKLFKSLFPDTGKLNPSVFGYRFDEPIKTEDSTFRYSNPKGYSPDVLFTPMPDIEYWLRKIIDKERPIFLTEGSQKAMSLLSQDCAAIAAPSISTFFQSAKQKYPGDPLPGLNPFFDRDRVIYVVPDSDFQINEDVALALVANLDKLVKLQSRFPFKAVRILLWEYTKGTKGIDDLLGSINKTERKEKIAKLMRESLTIAEFKEYLQTIKFDNSYNDANESIEDAVLRIINKQHPNTYYKTALEWFVKTDGCQLDGTDESEIRVMIASILSELVKIDCKGNRRKGLATQTNIKNCFGRFSDVCQKGTKLEQNPNNLYFQNGVFDTNTNTFRSYEADDISRINLPYSYNSRATCPDDIYSFWCEKYTDARISAEEQIELLQALIRFYLDFPEDQGWNWFVHLTGGSDTGKGVFCKLIGALYASENVAPIIDIAHLSDIKESYNYINDGTRLCIGDEIDAYIKNVGGLYSIVTGAKTPSRKMRQNIDPKAKPPSVKLLLASTAALGASMTTNDGLGRRIILLKTAGDKGEPTVGYIDFKALVGQYASWALQMPRAKVKETLMKLQQRNSDETALSSNAINRFITQCFLRVNTADRRHSTTADVTEEVIFQYYTAWSAYEGVNPVSRDKFTQRLKESIGSLYRDNKDRVTVNGKQVRLKNRYIGLQTAFKLDKDIQPLRLSNPSALIEGQTLTDLLREIDIRESEAIAYEQQEIKPIDFAPLTTPPEELAF